MKKRNNILKRISRVMTPDPTQGDFDVLDGEFNNLKKKLKEKITLKTLEEVNGKLDKYVRRIDLSSVETALSGLKNSIDEKMASYSEELEREAEALREDIKNSSSAAEISNLTARLDETRALIEELSKPKEDLITPIYAEIQALETRFNHTVANEREGLNSTVTKFADSSKELLNEELAKLIKLIEELRKDVFARLVSQGGGNANRQILFNSINRLTKYTDINLIPGNNVTFTVTEDNTNKRVNLTISSSGSGGGGITRFIQSVAVDTVAGSDADTDYVYLVSGTTAITLPTAAGNENLYTVKNVGNGVVTINTTGGETIDDDLTIVMPVKYTSVDIISNNSNWNIT